MSDTPFQDEAESFDVVLEVMEQVFTMPGVKEKPGSDEWIHARLKNPASITFADAARFPALCTSLVNWRIQHESDEQGFPEILHKEEVPGPEAVYNNDTVPFGATRGRMTAPARVLQFLRGGAHDVGILGVQNACVYPVRIPENPTGKPWNNLPQSGNTYHIHYCAAQGLTKSHPMARRVLLYIFYGKYQSKIQADQKKKFSVFRGIHKAATSARRRFPCKAAECFADFIRLVTRRPTLLMFLKDRGAGAPPMEYLAAVEKGLRQFGNKIHCMGSTALKSATSWAAVQPWRKREAYIAVARILLNESHNYKNWSNFNWGDYELRQALAVTFVSRHLALSDGTDHFDGMVEEPASWSDTVVSPTPQVRVKKEKKKNLACPKNEAPADPSPPEVMILDPKTGEFVVLKKT